MNAYLVTLAVVAVGFTLFSLGVCIAALRQGRASERLARGAELGLADRKNAALADKDGAAGTVPATAEAGLTADELALYAESGGVPLSEQVRR